MKDYTDKKVFTIPIYTNAAVSLGFIKARKPDNNVHKDVY